MEGSWLSASGADGLAATIPAVVAVPDPDRRFGPLAERALRHCSPRLHLRPFALEDAAPLWQATRHPDFNAWLTWPQPTAPAELLARAQRMLAQMQGQQACLLSAVDRGSGRWVGLYRMAADLWRADEGWFELGMWVHPDFWGAGLAAELHALGTSLAFEGSDTPGLSARTAAANVKAWKTLLRMGFERDHACDIAVEGAPAHPGHVYRLGRLAWARATQQPAAA